MNMIDRNYIPLANVLGIYYQIRDDYMNLQSVEVSYFCIVKIFYTLRHVMRPTFFWTHTIGLPTVFYNERFRWRPLWGEIFLPDHPWRTRWYVRQKSPRYFQHCNHALSVSYRYIDVLQKRPTTPTLKINTIAYLKNKTGSLAYTLGVLRTLEKQIGDEIQRLGGNPGLEEIIATLQIKE